MARIVVTICAIVLVYVSVAVTHSQITLTETEEVTLTNVSIIVVGRQGSEILKSIHELIDPHGLCENPEDSFTPFEITEYTISSSIVLKNGNKFQIRVVEVPGFGDNSAVEEDVRILSDLNSYMKEMGPPDFFLATSRFDDEEFDEEFMNSQYDDEGLPNLHTPYLHFVKFLKRLELIRTVLLEKQLNSEAEVVFLLTGLMNETDDVQRYPSFKMGKFRRVIGEHSSISLSHSSIVVGENRASIKYGHRVYGGYSLLPNNQLYPKNVWEALIKSANASRTTHSPEWKGNVLGALSAMKKSRRVKMECKVRRIPPYWDEFHTDKDAIKYLLTAKNITVKDNEVNREIDTAFRTKLTGGESKNTIQKIALQLYLQTENFTRKVDLPSGLFDRVHFFQQSHLLSSETPEALLLRAFQIGIPNFDQFHEIGRSYDIISGVSMPTVMRSVENVPSSIGYKLPSFMQCTKMASPWTKVITSFSENVDEYVMQLLHNTMNFGDVTNLQQLIGILKKQLIGPTQHGYNMRPLAGATTATITAVRETRTVWCKISGSQNWNLDTSFVRSLRDLQPVNLTSRDSVRQWTTFFRRYGTHIVTQQYGGGAMLGKLEGPNVISAYENWHTIENTLYSIGYFSSFEIPNLGKPSYRVVGGAMDSDIKDIWELSKHDRERLLEDWKESLKYNFVMLSHGKGFRKISALVMRKMPEKAEIIDEALTLHLNGELVFEKEDSSESVEYQSLEIDLPDFNDDAVGFTEQRYLSPCQNCRQTRLRLREEMEMQMGISNRGHA